MKGFKAHLPDAEDPRGAVPYKKKRPFSWETNVIRFEQLSVGS